MLLKDELYNILSGLIKIDTQNPPGNEDEAARFICAILKDNNIETAVSEVLPGRSNVYGFLRGNRKGPGVIFNGHTDVVPAGEGWISDPFVLKEKDGFIYGRGAADMKGGIAAMISAALSLKRGGCNFPGEVILVFNCDEERTNTGIRRFIKDDIKADFAIVGEPTGLDLCTGHKGCLRIRISTKGTAKHTGRADDPDNAIDKMTDILYSLKGLIKRVNSTKDNFLGSSAFTVSMIKGGTAPNIVAQSCEIEIDRRLIPPEDDKSALREINDNLKGLEYTLNDYLYLPYSLTDQNDPYVLKLKRSAEKVRGEEAEFKPFYASCEAPFFSRSMGIPAVIFGPGSLDMAHIKDEKVSFDEVFKASMIYRDFIAGGNFKGAGI